MVWPIGQAAGNRALALRSRELWDEAVTVAKLWSDPCGSLHVANADDEWNTLLHYRSFRACGNAWSARCRTTSARAFMSW